MSSLLETGRSHTCGALRLTDEGQRVTLFGWVNNRRDHGGRIFIDLRDREGLTQIVFGPDIAADTHAAAHDLRSEYCIGVSGKVIDRTKNEGLANKNLPTGAIEVAILVTTLATPARTMD